MRSFLFLSLLVLALAVPFVPARAGMAAYSESGKTDFDTAMQTLNAYGTWKKVDGLWAYTPLDHQAPYTHGRWLYTDYGWDWVGDLPHSWVTEHYGYWKRGADKVWAWYPGPFWLPQIVELRVTPTHVGWRSAQVDADGNFIESETERFSKADEWTFVTRAQFARPITPAVLATPVEAAQLLDDSTDSFHSYTTYRPIPRPGPHPADFLAVAGDAGMFAPKVYPETAQAAPAPLVSKASTAPAKAADAKPPAATAPAEDEANAGDPPADPRQVSYWTTMSLPTAWTSRPAAAQPNEIYLYRPDFYQDQDGIERRISLWLDPSTRTALGLRLRDVLNSRPVGPVATTPAHALVPQTGGAFRSPFDDAFSGAATGKAAPSSTPAPAKTAAPSGLAPSVSAPAPIPATNAEN
jgi:hypothetical protein